MDDRIILAAASFSVSGSSARGLLLWRDGEIDLPNKIVFEIK
jgi:hypothetical protein